MKSVAESSAEENTPKPKRSWLMGCAMTALIAGCVLALAGAFWWRHVAKERDRLAARVQFLLDEHQASRPALADEENAAPLYLSAFEKLVCSGDANFNELASRLENFAGTPKGDFTSQEVIALLAANQAGLKALEEAARRPKCDYGLSFDAAGSFAFPQVWKSRDAVLLLCIAARHEAQSGRPDAALARLELAIRVACGLRPDDPLICLSVRQKHSTLIWCVARRVLAESEPNEAGLKALLTLASRDDGASPRMEAALRAERVVTLHGASNFAGGHPGDNQVFGSLEDVLDPGITETSLFMWRAGMFPRDVELYESMLNQALADQAKPMPQLLDELEARASQWYRAMPPRWALSARSFVRAWPSIVSRTARAQTYAGITRLALACRLFRVKFGAYPESLAELAAKLPEHFKDLPADPFTGKPFCYKRTATGCLVWSVGSDRADDGGDPKKDIVFELKK